MNNSNWLPPYTGGPHFILATSSNPASTTFTYDLPSDPGAWSGSTGTLAWQSAAPHAVTVPVTTSVAFPIGSRITLSGMDASWNPSGVVPFTVTVLTSSTTQFTYAGPSSAPTGVSSGSWTNVAPTWSYAQDFAVRFRKVQGVSIQGASFAINVGEAVYDFDYTNTAQNHANNVCYAAPAAGGVWLPQSGNTNKRTILAGWTFYGCGNSPNSLDGHGFRAVGRTVASPAGNMIFADLPGQSGFQNGPFVGQEFDITDGTLASSGNFAATQTGGGSNKTRVRWNGSNWIITG